MPSLFTLSLWNSRNPVGIFRKSTDDSNDSALSWPFLWFRLLSTFLHFLGDLSNFSIPPLIAAALSDAPTTSISSIRLFLVCRCCCGCCCYDDCFLRKWTLLDRQVSQGSRQSCGCSVSLAIEDRLVTQSGQSSEPKVNRDAFEKDTLISTVMFWSSDVLPMFLRNSNISTCFISFTKKTKTSFNGQSTISTTSMSNGNHDFWP